MELRKSFMWTSYSILASNLGPTEQVPWNFFSSVAGRISDENAGMRWYSNLTFEITQLRLDCLNIIPKEIPHWN